VLKFFSILHIIQRPRYFAGILHFRNLLGRRSTKLPRKDGVSSVEAVALLLQDFGETVHVCDELVRYIQINNNALHFKHGTPVDGTLA